MEIKTYTHMNPVTAKLTFRTLGQNWRMSKTVTRFVQRKFCHSKCHTNIFLMKNLAKLLHARCWQCKEGEGINSYPILCHLLSTETDYPPTANAGPDKIVKLPQNSVVLYGNASTDDHGITAWEWSKETGGLADMKVGLQWLAVNIEFGRGKSFCPD